MDTKEIIYKLMHTHRHLGTHTLKKNPDGQTDAKKILRYTDPHRVTQTYVDRHTYIHTLHLKTDFLIPQFLQVSYWLNLLQFIYSYLLLHVQPKLCNPETPTCVWYWVWQRCYCSTEDKAWFFGLVLLNNCKSVWGKKWTLTPTSPTHNNQFLMNHRPKYER